MEKTKKYYKVLERFRDESSGNMVVRILCDCGNEVVKPSQFTSSKAKTCGNQCPVSRNLRSLALLGKPKPLSEKGSTGLTRIYDLYKRRANKKNIEFDISKEDFKVLTSSNCFYCGEPPSMVYIHKLKRASAREIENSRYLYNSLDRIDPNLGYTLSNVRPSCKCCNIMKWNHEEEFFKDRIKIFYNFYFNTQE